jgi:uncharacterized protein (DUF1501 family)
MKRRNFLKSALGATAAAPFILNGNYARATTPLSWLASLPQEADSDKILIICQLFGGNDGLNTVIPADDPEYYKLRPNINIPKDRCWNKIGNIYLNPTLSYGDAGGIATMLEMGNVAIVQGIGYDRPNLSHFRSTDIWLSGLNPSPDNASADIRLETGWIGRYLEQKYPGFPLTLPEDPLAIQLGGFSLALMSSKGRMGIEVINPAGQAGVGAFTDELDSQSAGTHYELEYAFIADIAARSDVYAQKVRNAYALGAPKLKGKYQTDSFAKQMAAVAALIAGGLQTKVYVVSMGGFDTHVTQQTGFNTGAHPSLLYRFSDAVANFMNDMISLEHADRVMGMSVSEFGRRPEENGSLGTDHGAASVQFVFGTHVNSGVYGKAPDLKNLNENSDLVYDIDYREVYAEVLGDWFGVPSLDTVREILQKDDLYPLDVLEPLPSSVSRTSGASFEIVGNYPNPFSSRTTLEISMTEATRVSIEVTSMRGERLAMVERMLDKGHQQIQLDLDLATGSYFCTVQSPQGKASRIISCVR